MTTYASAPNKAVATARMYYLGRRPVESLGPGSKEKKSSVEALGAAFGLDLTETHGKVECARQLASYLGVSWDEGCFSAGDTLTLTGLNRLVDGAVTLWIQQPSIVEESFVALIMAVEPAPAGDPTSASVASAQSPVQSLAPSRPDVHEPDSREPSIARVHGYRMEYDRGFVATAPSSPIEVALPEDASDLETSGETEAAIAQLLAQLSQSGRAPKGVDGAPETFSAGDVKFADGTWRNRLVQVQGWLNFSEDLAPSTLEDFDSALPRLLGLGSSGAPQDVPPSHLDIFERLLERLEQALQMREVFEERLDDEAEGGATLESATQEWYDAWSESEETEDAEGSGPIHASANTWPIVAFVGYAADSKLNLSPSYQRADVWPTRDAQMLIESVLRGIPLPSIILLRLTEQSRVTYEVVDGKQRLTSILRFVGNHPRALETVRAKAKLWGVSDLEQTFRTNYPAFKKLWKVHETVPLNAARERLYYFPFALRNGDVKPLAGELEPLRGRYYSQIREHTIHVGGEPREVKHLFEEQAEYKLPVIEYKQVTDAQVHEVFSLYNKQGKHLNSEEIRNALYHRLEFTGAMLVTAGDSDALTVVAPFLEPHWADLKSTQENLSKYGFLLAGYKRTKVLSWVAAALLVDDGTRPDSRSTANQINALFKRVSDKPKDPLRDRPTIVRLMLALDHALDAHASVPDEYWAAKFKNAQNQSRWQELQLVGALIGLSAASCVLGDELPDRLEAQLPTLLEVSGGDRWKRPAKTQSKEQWAHSSRVAGDMLTLLGVGHSEAHAHIREQLGSSGLAALLALND